MPRRTCDYPGVARAKLSVLRVLFEHFRREHALAQYTRGRCSSMRSSSSAASRCACTRCTTRSTNICERWTGTDTGAGRCGPRSCATRQAKVSAVRASMPRPSSSTPGCSGWPTSSLARRRSWRARLGMPIGLYGDYAVGVNPSGSETWSDQALYRKTAGVGAPPDALALKGQDWGIPPQDPNVLRGRAVPAFPGTCSPRTCVTSVRCGSITSWRCSASGGCPSAWVRRRADTCTIRSTTSCPCWRSKAHVTRAWSSAKTLAPCRRKCRTPMNERAVYSYRVLLFEKHGGRPVPGAGRISAPGHRHRHDARPADTAWVLVGQRHRTAQATRAVSKRRTQVAGRARARA